MVFAPIGCLLFGFFVLIIPVLFILIFFNLASFGFESLGISPQVVVIILLFILAGSFINIPVTRKTIVYSREVRFGWFRIPVHHESGLAINLGGAVIPIAVSMYLLLNAPLWPVVIATTLMIIICKFLTRPIPGRGLAIPMFIPPIFAATFGILFAREHAASVAFISGVLGTLIGGDLLNLRKARRLGAGIVSIGGAGVFDGIFLVGIISVLLTAFFG